MITKPVMKKEIGIFVAVKSVRFISGSGTNDALSELGEFGVVSTFEKDRFSILVDPRFDFDEVVAFIENYG